MKKNAINKFLFSGICMFATSLVLMSCGSSCSHENKTLTGKIDPSEASSGKFIYSCPDCHKEVYATIPKLTNKDYKITYLDATCLKPELRRYTSSTYGTYEVEIGDKLFHSTYAGRCNMCDELINSLEFIPENKQRLTSTGGYPRLYQLSDGTWLCGYDTGKIYVQRSEDEGETWSTPVKASFHDKDTCANVDFFELEDGDILCSYRAIGNDSGDRYLRAIYSSISHDGGLTWEAYNTVVSNYELGYSAEETRNIMQKHMGIGFYEPYVDVINGKVTVMYADDFSTMAEDVKGNVSQNYRCQYIQSKELIDGEWTNSKIIMNGAIEKTVGNNTRVSRDGMPVYAQMHNGTYVLIFEGTYRDLESPAHPFEIMMSYSKDGVNWSNPVEIYVPSGTGTKASAPFVCVTKDDRLIVSFQTDEECYAAGKGVGDAFSVMKVMISNGTPVEEITKDSFYTSINVFGTKPGKSSLWNGMMLVDDTIYCVSGTEGAVYMNASEIPAILDPINSYTKVKGEPTNLNVTKGSFVELENGLIKCTKNGSAATVKDLKIKNGRIRSAVILKNSLNQAGMTFRMNDNGEGYYYYVTSAGKVTLARIDSRGNTDTIYSSEDFMESHTPDSAYNLEVYMNGNLFSLWVNGEDFYDYEAESGYGGEQVGIRCYSENTLFSKIYVK